MASVDTTQEDDGEHCSDAVLTSQKEETSAFAVSPRWHTRVFSMECVCLLMSQCEDEAEAHFSMMQAQELKQKEPDRKLWFQSPVDIVQC